MRNYDNTCICITVMRMPSNSISKHHTRNPAWTLKHLLDIQAYIIMKHRVTVSSRLEDWTPHWTITLHMQAPAWSQVHLCIRLLAGCDWLEADASRFCFRNNHSSQTTSSVSSATLSLKTTSTSLPSACPILSLEQHPCSISTTPS